MQAITTIGLDIAKSVFQVHGIDAAGQVMMRRQLKRRYVLAFFQKLPACVVGIEACASSHYWSRELLALGHTVRLMPPAYVKPYVKPQKNDMADAEAICEAVTRANMRFVPTKTPEQQSGLMLRADMIFGRDRSGASAANSVADLRMRSASPPPQRTSICRLWPSAQPNCAKPCSNAAWRACVSKSPSPTPVKMPMRRIRSPCCAPAMCGHAAAAPPSSDMNSRRFTRSPPQQ